MVFVAPGRVALDNVDTVALAEAEAPVTHHKLDMAQAGRLGGPQREQLLRWLSASVQWPRANWAPPAVLPMRTPLKGPADFVRYDYRWEPGEKKFKDLGAKGNFPRDEDGAPLVVEEHVLPPHELEAKSLLGEAADGVLVARLISQLRPDLALPPDLEECNDVRGEAGVEARRANWRRLAACAVWKRLRLSKPTAQEEDQLARALPYRAERLLWALKARLSPTPTPVEVQMLKKEQRRAARLAARAKQDGGPPPAPPEEEEPEAAPAARHSQTKVVERSELRQHARGAMDEPTRRRKAVRKLLRSLKSILSTRPDVDAEGDLKLRTWHRQHGARGMDSSDVPGSDDAGPSRSSRLQSGRRLYGRSVTSAATFFEAVALGAARPPRTATLALGKEAEDAHALAERKRTISDRKQRLAVRLRPVHICLSVLRKEDAWKPDCRCECCRRPARRPRRARRRSSTAPGWATA